MQTVTVKVHPPGGTIILERPASRNAVNRKLLSDLSQALSDLHQEKRIRAVILTGAGSDFSIGMDLAELQTLAETQTDIDFPPWDEHWNELRGVLEQMLRYPKPLIAAVDGEALGSGFALALACDLVVATSRARFGVPAVLRGLVGGTVSPLLAWRVGGSAASRLLLTGESIDGVRAERLGLVHELVAENQIWVRAQAFCEQIASAPREALQLTKRLLNETIGEAVLSHLTVGAGMGAAICTTESAVEGIRAHLEQRPPKWP